VSAFTPKRFNVVHTAPAWLTIQERILIYALVAALQPTRVLEIGTFHGGSTLIISAALDDLGSAAPLLCVDPEPQVDPADWAMVKHRATMIRGRSPDALAAAREAAGGPFDFVLIDGDHSQDGVARDIVGVVPTLADDSHLLLHDALYWRVQEGIVRGLEATPDSFEDAGVVSVEGSPETSTEDGREVRWGGLRLLRYHRDHEPGLHREGD
jgi:cephalosporin hydroxylase